LEERRERDEPDERDEPRERAQEVEAHDVRQIGARSRELRSRANP
jgi:hypothetical protein